MAKFEMVRDKILDAKARISTHPDVDWDVEPFKTVNAILMATADVCEFCNQRSVVQRHGDRSEGEQTGEKSGQGEAVEGNKANEDEDKDERRIQVHQEVGEGPVAEVSRQRDAPLRLRRSSNIVCYWTEHRLVHHNFATGTGVVAGPRAIEVLDVFGDWRSIEEAAACLPHWNRRTLQRAVADLARSGLLHRSDRPPPDSEPRLEEWGGWNPAAGFFHQATKNVDYRVPVKPRRGRAVPAAPHPPPFKQVPSATVIHLPAERQDGELPQVLGARRTWRSFGRGAIDVQDVATMMGLTWRVRQWVPTAQGGSAALRTSPSGGACQPLEAYVLALRVRDIDRGLYHYSPERHTLALVRKGATARDVERYLAGQWWYKGAAAVVLISAVFERKRRRYRYARAYRSILAEAGHFCQTFCLVATWLDLAPFCTMALRDSEIEAALGIDGISESVIYAAGVGRKPRTAGDASQPPGLIAFD